VLLSLQIHSLFSSRVRGVPIANLKVKVQDSRLQEIPGVSKTDETGFFQIEDSEKYTAPFFLFFYPPQSDTVCGEYLIFVDPTHNGQVALDYYPQTSPCSCSCLIE
jgi:hypothetical protein